MKYFGATLKHKWFVLLASFKTGLPLWLAITHDLSKFSRAELPHYNRQFFGDKADGDGFAQAWLHHQNYNDHHPEWWVTRASRAYGDEQSDNGCLPMSDIAIRHMITDWLGAGRAYKGSWDITSWVNDNIRGMKMHPGTLWQTIAMLDILGLCKIDYQVKLCQSD